MSIYTDRTPYFYIIRHIPSGKKYAGCRYGRGCQPSDLLREYFTSSKYVKKLIEKDGLESFEIIEIKTDVDDVLIYERKFLKETNCAKSEEWMNAHNGDGNWRWEDLSEESKQNRINKAAKTHKKTWKNKSEKEKEKIRKSRQSWLKDKERVAKRNSKLAKTQNEPEVKKRVIEGRTKAIREKYGVDHQSHVPEIKDKTKKTIEELYGPMKIKKKWGDGPSPFKLKETHDKKRKTWKEKYGVDNVLVIPMTCKHCGKTLGKGNYNRWHGDRCKHRPKD